MKSEKTNVKVTISVEKLLKLDGARYWEGAGRQRVYLDNMGQFGLGMVAYGDVYYDRDLGLVFHAAKTGKLAKKAADAIKALAEA